MRKSLFVKVLVTGILAFLLIIPLSAIQGIVAERQVASQGVLTEIQQSGVGSQRLIGPILTVPYRKTVTLQVVDRNNKKSEIKNSENGQVYFLPDTLNINANVTTETRHRGIYSALLYNADQSLSGSFSVPENFGVAPALNTIYEWGEASVLLGVSDTRGIRGTPSFKWDNAEYPLKGGTLSSAIHSGVHIPLSRITSGKSYAFAVDLPLQGTSSIDYVPVGKQTTVTMSSEWPSPSFFGQFLPETRSVTHHGFSATWRTTHLASGIEDIMNECLRGTCPVLLNALGVSFVEPVNVYLETERAAKYGFLFVVFTFVIFQLFELLKKLAIHPVQYGLVGIALAMFFLLLVALAEHISFVASYAISASSCVGLLGFYVSYVLKSVKRAVGFTSILALLYGALYVLLQSEDMALLLGAILLFGILATIMVVTRKVDWHSIAAPATPPLAGA